MDMNRLVSMLSKLVFAALAKVLIGSLRKFFAATRHDNGSDAPLDPQQAAEAKELEKRARDTAKLMRRLGR